jgi:xanthine dehydrogenase accessory factor
MSGMFEAIAYYQKLTAAIQSGVHFWQASVVFTDGSTPARMGMKLAIPVNGDTFGNLGGGEMEYLVINTVRKQQPFTIMKLSYNLDEQGLPVSVSVNDKDTISELVAGGFMPPKGVPVKGTAARDSSNDIKTSMICGGRVEVMIEPMFSPYPLYIIGAGHCGRALAEFALKTDFQVTVIDNRADLLSDSAFNSQVRLVQNDYSCLEGAITFTDNAFIVIMTYGHVHDRQVLEYCLNRKFRYLGMIGSAKKVAETMVKVKSNGFSEEQINQIHAPIGLPIGSHTPAEIAISIIAEMISIRNLNKG